MYICKLPVTICMYIEYVHGVCTWSMYMEHVHGVCTWSMYMEYVHGVCTWSTYILYYKYVHVYRCEHSLIDRRTYVRTYGT